MEQIKIEWQGNTLGAQKWHATATVASAPGPDPLPVSQDTYAADGDTPLEAVTELARVLAKVVGYERSHAVAYAGEALKGSKEK